MLKTQSCRKTAHAPIQYEQIIAKAISNGDAVRALCVLEQLNGYHRAVLSEDSLRSLKNSLICSCTLFARGAIAGDAETEAVFALSDAYIKNIEAENADDKLLALEHEMICAFAKMTQKPKHYSKCVTEAMEYIENHVTQGITVQQTANAIFISKNYLSGQFHKECGETMQQFARKKRLQQAAHALTQTDDDIAEIARQYGFLSQSHFTKVFKELFGMTPGQYQKHSL